MKRQRCRYCGGLTRRIFSLGRIPLVNYFPLPKEATHTKRYPLDLRYCPVCQLGQTGIVVKPTNIFPLYHYVTGSSPPLIRHLTHLAETLQNDADVSTVLDIGCNDGTLLSIFRQQGHRVLGVEPAKNIAVIARSRGVPVVMDFFSMKTAKRILNKYGQFSLITVTHTLANIPDLRDFMRGIVLLLQPGGTLVIEVASFEDMVHRGQIDSMYHEHYYYFSQASLVRILNDAGLTVIRIGNDASQGGSTRVVATVGVQQKRLRIRRLSAKDIGSVANRTSSFRRTFVKLVRSYRGKNVVGFGAPAKAVTLLNWAGITPSDISYIVDSTSIKQGRVVPGSGIPVYPEEFLSGKHVDVVVLLAWNYREEVMRKIKKLVRPSPSIVVPFPVLRVFPGR